MKKLLPPAGVSFLLLTILMVSACRKTDLPCDPRDGKADLGLCQIREINNFPVEEEYNKRQLLFTYNSKGDPVTVTPYSVGTGSPRWTFYYDKKGRLVTFAGLYDNGLFEFWHNYHYDNKDRIVSDSIYFFRPVSNPRDSLGWRHAQIIYDNLNRVVKDIYTAGPQSSFGNFTIDYTYDARGNLNGSSFPYDDKANPLLTNKVWRFIARNYSVNNSGPASSYNANGLPTLFEYTPEAGLSFALWPVDGLHVNFFYDCKGGYGGHGL